MKSYTIRVMTSGTYELVDLIYVNAPSANQAYRKVSRMFKERRSFTLSKAFQA